MLKQGAGRRFMVHELLDEGACHIEEMLKTLVSASAIEREKECKGMKAYVDGKQMETVGNWIRSED